MTYPASLLRPFTALRPSRHWLALGAVTLGFGTACSDTTTNEGIEGIDAPTATSMGPTTASITTASVSAATTGNVASTTGGVTGSTTGGMSSAALSTSAIATTASSSTGAGGATSTTGGTTASGTGTGTDTSSGSGGAGGTGGGATFRPCPETPPCKILPLGDSITFGLGFDGGYRVELFRLALADGHEITFTGTQQPNGPNMVDGVTFPRNHAGISGQLIAEIAGRIPNPDMMDMPHIVLVHAGTNDISRSRNGAEDRLAALMDKVIAEAPDALIVFSNLIPLSFGGVEDFNAAVEPMVEERANAGAHILYVDQYVDFPNTELGDGVHPNEAGYARMAGKWYEAIEPYLR
ncbi:MAG TPA: SGNH/GDSL hydrolase family protein [Polyangiaceae bacterium]